MSQLVPVEERRGERPQRVGSVRRVLRKLGWPAYLIPLLLAATIFVLVDPNFNLGRSATASGAPEQAAGTLAADAHHTSPVGPEDVAACMANVDPQLVLVSVARQRAWMCTGSHVVYATPVTTGDVHTGDGTPIGTWTIESKETDRYLVGPGYRDFVHYWLPFFQDFGLHDASWQTMPFGDPGYRSQGSHGCVHLPTPAMSWLYNWAQVGTKITVAN